jgi:hypothetical protein
MGARARCGRRWRRQPAEVGGAGGDELEATSPTGSAEPGSRPRQQPPPSRRSAPSCPRSSPRRPTVRRSGTGPSARPVRQYSSAAPSRSRPARARSSSGAGRSSAGSPPGCGRARRALRPAPQRRHALLLGLADADQDPARERDPQLAGRADRFQPFGGMLGRRALVGDEPSGTTDSSIRPCDAVTSRRRPRSSRLSTPRFVCGSSPRSSARSQTHTT